MQDGGRVDGYEYIVTEGKNFYAIFDIDSENNTTATATADLKAEALVFNLEVPTSLPINVDNEGNVEVATDAIITNNSGGMVKVTNVSLDTTDSEWTIVDYETDFTKEKVGLTQFGITINEDEVATDGTMSLGEKWVSLYADGGTLSIDYEVNVASQASALSLSIATVEFTLDWDSEDVIKMSSVTMSEGEYDSYITFYGLGSYEAGEVVTITAMVSAEAYSLIDSSLYIYDDSGLYLAGYTACNISTTATLIEVCTFTMPDYDMVFSYYCSHSGGLLS